jgi:hypothetical protein
VSLDRSVTSFSATRAVRIEGREKCFERTPRVTVTRRASFGCCSGSLQRPRLFAQTDGSDESRRNAYYARTHSARHASTAFGWKRGEMKDVDESDAVLGVDLGVV